MNSFESTLAVLVALMPACSSSSEAEPNGKSKPGNGIEALAWQSLLTGDWQLDPGAEDYYCVRKTMTEDVWVGAFRPVAPLGTHHTTLGIAVLGLNLGPDGTTKCAGSDLGAEILLGSGVGTEPMQFPDGVAVRIPAGTQLLLNLHLFNASDRPLSGTSGVEMVRVDPADAANEAQLVLAGKVADLTVPPGRTTQTGTCTLPTDVTVFSVFPHMHQRGAHLMGRAIPKDGSTPTTLIDRDYSFDDQTFSPVSPALSLEHGSTLEVNCTYENTGSTTLAFGQSSNEEMCFMGTYVYPAVYPGIVCSDTPGGQKCGDDGTAPGLEVLASGLPSPATLAVDGTSVYWVNSAPEGSVMKMPLAGGAPTKLASGQTGPWGVAVDSASVYWTNFTSGAVMKLPIQGGTPTTLASSQSGPNSIATDGTNVYWTNYNDGTIMKVSAAGGTPTVLASGPGSPDTLAVDATNVYWTNPASGTVMKVALTGGTPETLASDQSGPQGIVVDAANVYWVNHNDGAVMAASIAGGTPTTLAAGTGPVTLDWSGIAIDAANVYWATGDGSIMSLPKGGGTPTPLASGQQRPSNIVADGTSVYFTTYCGSVIKLTPK